MGSLILLYVSTETRAGFLFDCHRLCVYSVGELCWLHKQIVTCDRQGRSCFDFILKKKIDLLLAESSCVKTQ